MDPLEEQFIRMKHAYYVKKFEVYRTEFTQKLSQEGRLYYRYETDVDSCETCDGSLSEDELTELKDLYKELALKYHPDKNPDDRDLFIEVDKAYKAKDLEKLKQIKNGITNDSTLTGMLAEIKWIETRLAWKWGEEKQSRPYIESLYMTEEEKDSPEQEVPLQNLTVMLNQMTIDDVNKLFQQLHTMFLDRQLEYEKEFTEKINASYIDIKKAVETLNFKNKQNIINLIVSCQDLEFRRVKEKNVYLVESMRERRRCFIEELSMKKGTPGQMKKLENDIYKVMIEIKKLYEQ